MKKNMKFFSSLLAIVMLITSFAGVAYAEELVAFTPETSVLGEVAETYSISGVVLKGEVDFPSADLYLIKLDVATDAEQAVIDAAFDARDFAAADLTGTKVTSDAQGEFVFTAVEPGVYKIFVEGNNYETDEAVSAIVIDDDVTLADEVVAKDKAGSEPEPTLAPTPTPAVVKGTVTGTEEKVTLYVVKTSTTSTAYPSDTNLSTESTGGSTNAFKFEKLQSGTYNIYIKSETSYITTSPQFTLGSSDVENISVAVSAVPNVTFAPFEVTASTNNATAAAARNIETLQNLESSVLFTINNSTTTPATGTVTARLEGTIPAGVMQVSVNGATPVDVVVNNNEFVIAGADFDNNVLSLELFFNNSTTNAVSASLVILSGTNTLINQPINFSTVSTSPIVREGYTVKIKITDIINYVGTGSVYDSDVRPSPSVAPVPGEKFYFPRKGNTGNYASLKGVYLSVDNSSDTLLSTSNYDSNKDSYFIIPDFGKSYEIEFVYEIPIPGRSSSSSGGSNPIYYGAGSTVSASGGEGTSTRFTDTKTFTWAEEAIEKLAVLGIVNGRAEGIFDPGANVTREEFTKMALGVFEIKAINGESTGFSDVVSGEWYEGFVAAAKRDGLITGYTDGTFGIGKFITREEACTIAFNGMKEKFVFAIKNSNSFADAAKIQSWATNAVSTLASEEIVAGYPEDNTFKPSNNITRAEAAVILHRIYTKYVR